MPQKVTRSQGVIITQPECTLSVTRRPSIARCQNAGIQPGASLGLKLYLRAISVGRERETFEVLVFLFTVPVANKSMLH